ncbi:MAG: PAS domain S-box protein [Archaeoglobaceae archaeon]
MELDFKKIADESLAGIYVHDRNLRILYVNEVVERATKYSRDELLKMRVTDLVYPEDRPKVMEIVREALSGKIKFYELRYVRKDGKVRWAWGFCKQFGDLILGNWIDVTRMKLLEEELKQSEEFHRSLIEESLAAVYIVDENGFIYVNRAAEEIAEYSKDELLKMNPLQLVHPEDRELVAKRLAERLAGKRGPETYGFRIVAKSGKVKHVTVRPSRILYRGKPAVAATAIETTQLYETSKMLEMREEYMKLVNKMLRHDVANALTAIRLAIEAAMEGDDSLLERALDRCDYIARLISVSRDLESALGELKVVRLDEVARDVAESFGVKFDGRAVEVLANDALVTIVTNLVDNALKHGKTGVKVEVTANDRWGILRVSDTGKGIPDELKRRIFEEGFSGGGGSGLGLYIVKKLVEILGGSVDVRDNVPSGTVFELRLPKP